MSNRYVTELVCALYATLSKALQLQSSIKETTFFRFPEMHIWYLLVMAFSVVILGDNNSSFLPFHFTQLTELFVFEWMTVGLLWKSHDIIFTSWNIFVFGSRIFWRTELLSFRRNARNLRRNLRERKEHLNCKQSLIIRVCSRVYAFFWPILHHRSCYLISPLLSEFSYFMLLFWVLTLKPSPLVYCANAGEFFSLALCVLMLCMTQLCSVTLPTPPLPLP